MKDWTDVVAVITSGLLIGLLFFGGLWMTVILLNRTNNPALTLISSAIIRFAILLGGFRLVLLFGGADAIAASAIVFLLARAVIVRHARAAVSIKTRHSGDQQ